MSFEPDNLLVSVLAVVTMVAIVTSHLGRRLADRVREHEVAEACDHLKNYHDKISELLKFKLPDELARLVERFNDLLLNPAYREFFENRERGDRLSDSKSPPPQRHTVTSENAELYRLYMEAAMEGILAVSKRDPQLAAVWMEALPSFASEPERTTAIIASEARDFVAGKELALA